MNRRRSAFSEFERLHEQMDQMWRRLPGRRPAVPVSAVRLLAPPTDVYETRDAVVIVAEIAGIEQQEVDIEIEGDHLRFHGEKIDRDADPATGTLRWRYATVSSDATSSCRRRSIPKALRCPTQRVFCASSCRSYRSRSVSRVRVKVHRKRE